MNSAPIIPAATILLIRDGLEGLEVFMVVRHHQIDFASGALVFPGGKVDAQDSSVADLCDGIEGLSEGDIAMQVGAVREAFEECGVLLARDKNGDVISGERLSTLQDDRAKLNAGELGLRDFLGREQLRLACDLLVPFAHWITPEMMPKRFDTKFYLVDAPNDQLLAHDGYESVDSIWIPPKAALQGNAEGTYTIIFPTRLNVELLAESDSVAAALTASRSRNIVTVLPWTEKRDDGTYLCIRGDAGYAVFEEMMPARGG
jgi:8-oxo-dGTP pyrophosphatase MutT (NUDIX family)